ncbi:MAG: glycerophosphodiester phosphodiesterase [Candidatus Glassbacteria bacterium]|nr:glycerophosphodiester phosphodiesterase [Candidatus Glassbacteria bacterium]
MSEFIFFAHRGAAGHEPENTLLAVRKALDLGAKWIEVDVRLAEGEPVVIHDAGLGRTTDGTGYVAGRSLAYLRSLDAGKGERIPLLREVFDLAGARAGINVELKGRGAAGPVVSLIREYLDCRGWTFDQVLVSSFHPGELKTVSSLRSQIRLGLNLRHPGPKSLLAAQGLGAWSVHLGLGSVRRRLVEDAHRKGLKVFVFTVNRAEDLERVCLLGVDGVFTDYSELGIGNP